MFEEKNMMQPEICGQGVEDEIKEVTRGQIRQFVNPGGESGFYSKSNGKPQEDFAQDNDML